MCDVKCEECGTWLEAYCPKCDGELEKEQETFDFEELLAKMREIAKRMGLTMGLTFTIVIDETGLMEAAKKELREVKAQE